ncbi:uncharacterized protein LOC128265902 isoform X2 [Drosophila gunungcola]|uniref:uncharacterized protein LOC128265902 isoform X2 n=1 Tax=Drosophila gunungcola TaxID=103775 RepID=UPI0022DEBC4D|nr:uncharacterized protein LOC128265902 isoform X2 [Drosophila gunungcola]
MIRLLDRVCSPRSCFSRTKASKLRSKGKIEKPAPIGPSWPSSRKEKSHHRVIELNKVRGLEMQHKKLENLQSEFMHKIRTLAPQKLQGVYKFVAVVVNEKCKVVVHDYDLHRLPKNLLIPVN